LRYLEEIGGSGLAPKTLGITIAGNGGGEEFVKAADTRERLGVVFDIGVERPGKRVAAFVVFGGVEGEKRGGIANGSGMEDKAADHSKDGGVSADSEGESEDGDSREGGFVREKTCGQTESMEERFKEGDGLLFADELFDLLLATEGEEGLAAGFLWRHTAEKVVVDVELEMGV
jgi:hypothetical protein